MCPIIINSLCVPLISLSEVSHYHRQLKCPIINSWCVPLSSTAEVSNYHRQLMFPTQLQTLLEILGFPNGILERKPDKQWRCSTALLRISRPNSCVTQMLHTTFSRQRPSLYRHTLQVKHSATELLQLAVCVHGSNSSSNSSNRKINVMEQGTASEPWRNNHTCGQKNSTPFYEKMMIMMMIMMITIVPTKLKKVGSQGS
jgi:hypothetical protein